MTQRGIIKLINCVKVKVEDRIVSVIGEEYREDVQEALAQGGDIEEKLIEKIQNAEVDLVDDEDNKLIERQITREVEKFEKKQSDQEVDEVEECESPSIKSAKLEMDQKNYKDIHNDVVKYVRRNSKLDQAKNLKELQITINDEDDE